MSKTRGPLDPAPPTEPWLDELLRAPHIDDDGFAAAVSVALPPPRRRPRFVVFAFGLLAVGVGAFVVRDIEVMALQANLLLLICAGVGLTVAAVASGEMRFSPALLAPAFAAGDHAVAALEPHTSTAVPNGLASDHRQKTRR